MAKEDWVIDGRAVISLVVNHADDVQVREFVRSIADKEAVILYLAGAAAAQFKNPEEWQQRLLTLATIESNEGER